MIYHIANKKDWEAAINNNSYKADSLDKEGFIHCSPIEKVLEVANNFYKGQTDLLLLSIDESKVKSKIVWEDLYAHDYEFPHIYGELNLDAVIKVINLTCNTDGSFVFPE